MNTVGGAAAGELRTPRLLLSRPTVHDVDAIFAITADPRTTAHNPSDAIVTRRDAVDLFHRWDDQWQRYGFGYYVVRRHDSDLILGFCGVKVMPFRDTWVLNLFYRFGPAAWGHGIASEAAGAVVEWAATYTPEWTVVARVRPQNIASQRVAVKAGLVRAPHLDGQGCDGLDLIFAAVPQRARRRFRRRG